MVDVNPKVERTMRQSIGVVGWALAIVGTVLGVAVLGAGAAVADGPVQLRSRLGDVCLDAPSTSIYTAVVINPCNGSDFQRWNLNGGRLESVAFPGECLTIPDGFFSHLVPCIATYAQNWGLQPNGQVTVGWYCLTVLGGPAPGTWVSTRWCNGDPNQGWDSVS